MLILAKDDQWSYTVMADDNSLKDALVTLNERAKDHLLRANPQLQTQNECRSTN